MQTVPVRLARPLRPRRGRAVDGPLPREVYVLGLIAFCVAVGFGVLVPVLPVFARSFGVDNFQVGAVVSAGGVVPTVTTCVLVASMLPALSHDTNVTVVVAEREKGAVYVVPPAPVFVGVVPSSV